VACATSAPDEIAQIHWQTSARTAQGLAAGTEPPQVTSLPMAQIPMAQDIDAVNGGFHRARRLASGAALPTGQFTDPANAEGRHQNR
jgi:hypothetical protein